MTVPYICWLVLEGEGLRPNSLKYICCQQPSVGDEVVNTVMKPVLLLPLSLQRWRNGSYEAKWHDVSADEDGWEGRTVDWEKQWLSPKYRYGWRRGAEVSQGWAHTSSVSGLLSGGFIWAIRMQMMRFPSADLGLTFSTILLILTSWIFIVVGPVRQ